MQIKNKHLFLKYALPCASVLIKRGWVKKEIIDRLKEKVLSGDNIDEDVRCIFVVASSLCSLIAKKMKKRKIDDDVIRKYFWYYHDEVVDNRYEKMRDFDPVLCKTYPGKILEVRDQDIVVETPRGQVTCRESFENVKPGDFVVIHYNYIIEKIDEQTAKNLWQKKK